uniref:Uncharacterized protein n=1 Tax=Pongo abelii TaxID=9601 RepID=A0A8I5U2K4_PONAB
MSMPHQAVLSRWNESTPNIPFWKKPPLCCTSNTSTYTEAPRSSKARQMFEGEWATLEALQSTGLVQAPRPMKVIDLLRGGAAFVMEHLKMRSLSRAAHRTTAKGTGSGQEDNGPVPSGLLCPY